MICVKIPVDLEEVIPDSFCSLLYTTLLVTHQNQVDEQGTTD